jgi:phospholipid/cholesterol/gamma-HCH transport system permease protein
MGKISLETEAGVPTIRIREGLDESDRAALEAALSELPRRPEGRVSFDLSGVGRPTALGRLLLAQQLWTLRERQVQTELKPEDHPVCREVGSLLDGIDAVHRRPRLQPDGFMAEVGDASLRGFGTAGEARRFLADTLRWTFVRPFQGFRLKTAQIWESLADVGVEALPIMAVMMFLIGAVLCMQGAHQLKQFGAGIFVADLVALGIVREMGPLVVAILFAGRSGSSFAATLGSMQINEEIPALRLMGEHPVAYLVVPRLIASVLAVPMLVVLADLIGVAGGLAWSLTMDISPATYLARTAESLDLGHILKGLIKAPVFGAIIALVGCFKGMQPVQTTEDVGKATTASVVWSIFLIIVADSTINAVTVLWEVR